MKASVLPYASPLYTPRASPSLRYGVRSEDGKDDVLAIYPERE